MIRNIAAVFIAFFALWGIISMFASFGAQRKADKQYIEIVKREHSAFAFPLPEELTFAGEKVPLENIDTRESLDLELQKIGYWHSEVILYIKRANRFFPVIEPILKKNGIPDDFKYFAVCESGLLNVTSPAGARGIWQFMESTAKHYDLEVNDEVDERYNLELATQAACKYFKDSYKKFKSWALVAASYNTGQGNVDTKIKDQNQESYYDLLLNEETARYVFRTIAIKLILTNPSQYGFHCRNKDLYPIIPSKTVEIDSAVQDFAQFASHFKTSYKMLKLLNPWLRKPNLVNKQKRKYSIRIPEKGARTADYRRLVENPDSLIDVKN